ncbi:MAG TPA: redox-sensitive transcriptional activator SoxR [Acidisoma sp.]|jgi:MerR family redox-sensitive transcriptional activator SoxR|nr:redox-sensitive transcriptional activator SoxR [Acidisoma sp.]
MVEVKGMDATANGNLRQQLSVGEVARRSGVPVSTLHFYEAKGLIAPSRSSGNHRQYSRTILRRIAAIRVAQRAGIPLATIRDAMEALPDGRTPTAADWQKLARDWRDMLQIRIDSLTQLRDQFEHCIGCGCLSLTECPLRNPADTLGRTGSGPVLLNRMR